MQISLFFIDNKFRNLGLRGTLLYRASNETGVCKNGEKREFSTNKQLYLR